MMRKKRENEWDQHPIPHTFQTDACTVISIPLARVAAVWEKSSVLADSMSILPFFNEV